MRLTHATEDVRRRRAEWWLEQYGRIFYLTKQRRRGGSRSWGSAAELPRRLEREADQLFETALAGGWRVGAAESDRTEAVVSSPIAAASDQRAVPDADLAAAARVSASRGDRGSERVLDDNLAERTLHPLLGGWTSSADRQLSAPPCSEGGFDWADLWPGGGRPQTTRSSRPRHSRAAPSSRPAIRNRARTAFPRHHPEECCPAPGEPLAVPGKVASRLRSIG